MPARLKIHYRDRSDLPMSDRDIWLDYKNARNQRMQVRILAELNETKKQTIEEIINEQRAIEERKLILLKEDEQVKQTEEERKAKKAAYMKEYWARKKAEKTEPQPAPIRPITVTAVEQAPETEQAPEPITELIANHGTVDLIRKAVQYYSYELADAVTNQRERVKEEQEKLRKMEEDLERCQKLLGQESKEDSEEVAENVCD